MTPRSVRTAAKVVGVALVAFTIFRLARAMQEGGHGWGDDFALYINQARGLTDGTADAVVAANRFSLDNSAYRFGPVSYPWGFPMLLAPVIAVAGLDYAALKLVGTCCLVLGVLLFGWLLARRLAPWEVVVATAMVGANSWYLGWTDSVLSDVPFFCSVMVALAVMDLALRRDRLTLIGWPGALAIGGAIAFAFNVRREGGVLLLALAAAQLAALVTEHRRGDVADRRFVDLVRARATSVAAPHVTFVVLVAALQVARPATIVNPSDEYGPSGRQHIRFNVEWYRGPLAELLGLKDAGPVEMTMLGSHALGVAVFTSFLVLAVVGVVAAVVRQPARDAHLVVTLLGITYAVLVQPFREGRYLLTIFPLLVYFAFRGVRSALAVAAMLVRLRGPIARRVRAAVPAVVLAPLLVAIWTDTSRTLDYHLEYQYVNWGPESPETQELFDAVRRFTDARDVVVFAQARTMSLYTRRLAIQGNNVSMMTERGDWYAMTRDSDYIQTPLTDAQAAELGFVKVWENSVYVLWWIPDRPPPPPCC